VVFLAKRRASFVVCVALLCGVDPAGLRGDLSTRRGSDALTCNRTGSVPAELAPGRDSPRLFASGRQFPSHELQPAVTAAHSGSAVGDRWTRLARPSTWVDTFLATYTRAERGPPQHVLS